MSSTERQIIVLAHRVNRTINGFDKILQLSGLPEAFKGVAKCLLLTKEVVDTTRAQLRKLQPKDEKALETLLGNCQDNLNIIYTISRGVYSRSKGKYDASEYRAIAIRVDNQRVETLMDDILECLGDMFAQEAFQGGMEKEINMLAKAREELAELPPSLPESDFDEQPRAATMYGDNNRQYNASGSAMEKNVGGSYFEAKGVQNFGTIPLKGKEDDGKSQKRGLPMKSPHKTSSGVPESLTQQIMSQWGAVNFSHPQSRNVQLENDYNPANSNEVIRRAIVLDKNHRTYERIVFSISWDLPAFMANQYKTKCPLGSVITLSGTAMYAQAITCEEYSKMNWHKYGLEVLIILQRALDSSDLTYSGAYQDFALSVDFREGRSVISVFSSNEIIIDIAQQVAWMAAAFRTSDCNRVQYSKVAICYETGGSSDFNITFAIEPLSKEEESCWFPLFLNPVIAFGFPIRERHNEEVGLELPIEMMVALGRTRHAIGEVVPFVGADPESHGIQAAANVMIKMAPSLLFKDPMPRGKDRYFDDEVSDIWSLLERLGESQNSEQSSPGKNLQTTMKTKVIGWEFMGLVDQKSPYVRKQIFVKTSCGGWPELVHDIDAVVLVAQGFEDIIRPVSELARLCSIWQSLPKHKYFMAAGVPILQKLCEEAGSDKTNQHLTSTKLKWHKGSLLFEDCLAHTNAGMVCKCDRLQQVVPEGITLRSIKPPGVLEANGCVIFGKPPSRSTAELSPNTTTNYLYTHPNNPIEMTTDTDSILIPRTLNGEGFQHLRPDNASAFS